MTGIKILDTILGALSLIVAGLCVGIFVYTEVIYKRPNFNNEAEEKNLTTETEESLDIRPYKLNRLTINLKSRTKRLRFLDVVIHLVPFKNSTNQLFEDNQAVINDSIITIAGAMNPDELNSVAGKILLEDRIKRQINKKFNKPVLKEVFYSKFVVQ